MRLTWALALLALLSVAAFVVNAEESEDTVVEEEADADEPVDCTVFMKAVAVPWRAVHSKLQVALHKIKTEHAYDTCAPQRIQDVRNALKDMPSVNELDEMVTLLEGHAKKNGFTDHCETGWRFAAENIKHWKMNNANIHRTLAGAEEDCEQYWGHVIAYLHDAAHLREPDQLFSDACAEKLAHCK